MDIWKLVFGTAEFSLDYCRELIVEDTFFNLDYCNGKWEDRKENPSCTEKGSITMGIMQEYTCDYSGDFSK